MIRKGISLLCGLLSVSGVGAQSKQHQQAAQTWVGYLNQTRFTNRWGAWLDAHLRTKEDLVSNLSQGILRTGLTYYLSDAAKLTAGYAYVHHYPADGHPYIAQPEHRPWQQLQWHTRYAKTRTMQWLRLEERFRRKVLNDSTLGEGHHFNFRLRYNFLFQVPLTTGDLKANSVSLVVNNEVHINFGKQIVYNYFDQNRFFVGFNYYLNAHDNLQAGYMNLFQQLPAGNRYRTIHAARLFYFHNLDLRKK
jgi:hypothetical protein